MKTQLAILSISSLLLAYSSSSADTSSLADTRPLACKQLARKLICWKKTYTKTHTPISPRPTATPTALSAASPTPTPPQTPMSSPTPSPSEAPFPFGSVPPPPGTQWVVTENDTFINDSGIDTSYWHGGPGGGVAFCNTANNPADLFGHSAPIGEPDVCNEFYGSPFTAPYDAVVTGTGLLVQPFILGTPITDFNTTNQAWMGIQNNGHPQEFGYFEWNAKLPSDISGEGDGYHIDLWCQPVGRSDFANNSVEIDTMEKVLGTANRTYGQYNIVEFDSTIPNGQSFYGVPGGGNLDDSFHVFGAYWRNDGQGAFGSVQIYADGRPVSPTIPLNQSLWGQGVYCFAGWAQQNFITGAFGGGNDVGPNTSNENPLTVQWFREWQGQ